MGQSNDPGLSRGDTLSKSELSFDQIISRFLGGPLAVFCAVIAAPVVSAQTNSWPTTEFVIVNHDPNSAIPGSLNPFSGFSDEEEKVIAEYEQYLTKVARDYQSMGFKAPPLPMTKGREGGDAYRVNMFDYNDKDPTAMAGYFPDDSIALWIDFSRAIVNGKSVDRTFEDLAHELFHNVQRGYVGPYSLEHGKWITEGQAQALGMYAANAHRGIDIYKGKKDGYRLGGRPYYRPLPTETHDLTYRTASLWRYIGEQHAAAKMNQRPGTEPIDPDYSYLVKVYEQRFEGPNTTQADLRWLDAGLRNATGLGLSRLYASFVATFSSYVPVRLTKPPSGSAEEAEDNWLNFVFGLCPEISLSERATSGSTDTALRKNGSRCFKVNTSGDGFADISIHTRAETVEALRALQIGTSGGSKIGPAQIVSSPAGGGYLGHWRFRIPAGTYNVFIVSNMAGDPTKTINQDLTFTITSSQWDSSMTTPRPEDYPGPKQNNNTRTNGANKTTSPAPARKAATGELKAGLNALSNQTALGASANFERDRAPCAGDFAAAGCGPVTGINLTLTPGAIGDTTVISGAGGVLGQFMSQISAIADNGAFQTDSGWKAAAEEIRDTEGSYVKIVIPAIEYGFTGSFSNAAISVNSGTGADGLRHEDYRALGPEDSIPGRGREFRQSGRVTIDEFTPFVLRGSFEAGLTDLSRVEFTEEDLDPTLPVFRTVRGNFSIAAPWEGDSDVVVYYQPPLDSAEQDMVQAFPGIEGFDLSEMIKPTASAGSPAAPAGRLIPFPSCNCSCQPLENYSSICRPICKVKVSQCDVEQAFEARLAAKQKEKSALAGDVDQMRLDFENYLDQENMGGLKDSILLRYDEQSSPEAKRKIMMSYGMNVGAYGDDETQRRAAKPANPTREEYIQGLRDLGYSDEKIESLLTMMDAAMAELGGWPKK
jgi:hypothetical protein